MLSSVALQIDTLRYVDDKVTYPTIECVGCGCKIKLTRFTDNSKHSYNSGCGWDYECECGEVGFVWEGAFDN